MKQRKRFIAYVLTLAMLAGFYVPAEIAYAQQTLTTSDGKFSYEVSGDAVTITGYLGPKSGNNRAIEIPATIDGRTVTGIGYCNNDSDAKGVFQGNYEFNTIYLPDTLEVIGDCTFCGCGLATIYVYAASGEVTGDVSGNASGNASTDASGNASGDTSADASGDVSADASGNASGDASGNASGDNTLNLSNNTSGEGSDDVSADASGNASGNGSGDASGNSSGNGSEDTSGNGTASGDTSNLLYKDTINPLPSHLRKLGARAFENSGLTTITLPVSITYIGDSAFKFCKFTSFTLPEGSHVTYIGKDVLFSGINDIALNGTVDVISDNAFSNMGQLKTFTANRIGVIGNNAFQNSTLSTFTITGALTTIKEETFKGCGGLETVIIQSDTPYSIEPYAFNCSTIKNIQLSEGITTIEEGTFSNCGKLSTVVLPDSLTNIEKDAFQNVSSITNINIGDNVIVDKDAFEGAGGSTLEALGSSNNPTIKEIIASKGGNPNPPAITPSTTTQTPPTTQAPAVNPSVKKVSLKSAKKNKAKTKVTLKWKKASGVSGYTIYVKAVAKGKKAKKISWKKVANVSAKKTSYTVKLTSKQKKLLKKKGTLYFSIRAYKKANGKTYYGKYSNTKKVKK